MTLAHLVRILLRLLSLRENVRAHGRAGGAILVRAYRRRRP